MFKFCDSSKIQNEILKCDKCKAPFDEYCQPKCLPCFKTICTTCELTIEKEALNKRFKCSVCLNDHIIPDDGFVLNEIVTKIITTETMKISRGNECENLKKNLKKILSTTNLLRHDCENDTIITDIFREYFNEQKKLIQLSTENKIEQINKFNDELIAFVKEYERSCIESYSIKNKPLIKEDINKTIQDAHTFFKENQDKIEYIKKLNNKLIAFIRDYERICIESYLIKKNLVKEDANKIIQEANTFLYEKQSYLQQYQIDDEEIKVFNKKSEELQLDLNEKSKKLKSLIFNEKLIKFLSNINEVNTIELENFDYEYSREPSYVITSGSANNCIKILELESGKCIKAFDGNSSSVTCIKNVLDDKLISGDDQGSIKIFKIKTGVCLKTINAHASAIYKILLISNDRFSTCSSDKMIKLFDLNTFECIRKFIGHEDVVWCIERLSNDKIISCSRDFTIRIWDLDSGRCLKILKEHGKSVTSMIVSDDKIISGSDGEIKVWNFGSGDCLQTLNVGHNNYVRSIVKISNEKVASGDQDGILIIWNINSGKILKTINAHSGSIWRLSELSKNKIISCSRDKTIKVWDINIGICLRTLEGHSNAIYGLDLLI